MSLTSERLLYERALPAFPTCVALVRTELDAALAEAHVRPSRRYEISLAVTEAAGNAVLHAYPPLPPGLLFVDAAIAGRNLLLRVCDCGRGMPGEAPRGGIGLGLISRLADGVEIGANRFVGGTRVAAMFRDVTPPGAPRPRGKRRRADAVLMRDYIRALETSSDALRSDAEALLAEAREAIDRADRLRAERRR